MRVYGKITCSPAGWDRGADPPLRSKTADWCAMVFHNKKLYSHFLCMFCVAKFRLYIYN